MIVNKVWGFGYFVVLLDEGIVWSYWLSWVVVVVCCGLVLVIFGVVL